MGGSIVAASVFALGGNLLVVALYDPRFEIVGPLLVLMSVSYLPSLVIGGYGNMIVTRGHSRRYAAFITTSAVIKTALLVLAISQYGLIGAALTPALSTLLFYPFMLWFIWPYGGWIVKQDIVFMGVAIAVAALAIWLNYGVIIEAFTRFLPA